MDRRSLATFRSGFLVCAVSCLSAAEAGAQVPGPTPAKEPRVVLSCTAASPEVRTPMRLSGTPLKPKPHPRQDAFSQGDGGDQGKGKEAAGTQCRLLVLREDTSTPKRAPRAATGLADAHHSPPAETVVPVGEGLYLASVPSHYAGFVSNYPHDDGPSYNVYNSVNEKMPLWGAASGGPAPGVANAVWIGGDFDQKYTTAPCGTPGDCYIPPPVDGMYRGWRTQGYSYGPCNCPIDVQRAYFSANRGLCMFDLSALPDHATVTRVGFLGKIAKQFGGGERLNLSQIDVDRSRGHENLPGTGFEFAYDDCSDGSLYALSWNVSPYAVGNPASIDLGAAALTDLSSALARNWFGVGLVSGAGETASTSYYYGAFEGSGAGTPPALSVEYRYTVPDAPSRNGAGLAPSGGGICTPNLEWNIPDEADGHALHFELLLSDTGPVWVEEGFKDPSKVDFALTSYSGMLDTATHDIYDEAGILLRTETPSVHLQPFDLTYGGNPYAYGNGSNVGWRFGRPFVSHTASDTWTGGGYTVDGLGDALAGREYMEWSSVNSISYPSTACATNLGYPANLTGVGGYLPSGITESFYLAVDYDDTPDTGFNIIATGTNISGSFMATIDPPMQKVIAVGLFFTGSSNGYAYLSDLQLFDEKIYPTGSPQTLTSSVVSDTGDPAIPIGHATLTASDSKPSGTSVAYELSNDAGTTWYLVTPGVDFVFPSSGHQLRWRATLATSDSALTPRVYSVAISNLIGTGMPLKTAISTAGFTQNETGAGTFLPFPAAGVPEHSGVWRQTRYSPSALADGTYFWRVRAVAPSGSGDPGGLSPTWTFSMAASDATPPPGAGDVLRGSRGLSGEALLAWPLYTDDPTAHFHLYAGPAPSMAGATLTEVFGKAYSDLSAATRIFYDLRAADDCENESGS